MRGGYVVCDAYYDSIAQINSYGPMGSHYYYLHRIT
jgi:hypothetical protein